ncbi:RNA-directed DNA polymerase, eukaryota, Reverse transcriptase zinc-binding domain protein [Artemisia annua]|uniref:RNA-directed DNA polymerase, eukaryota, Reverse transcriptase zinc-binding domain protein n=1 Tax=Artemisia annua TaxID=35608 RepID=A0A2U1PYU4_ARTAN|nr:RNA-directed DNA polymerase, eukaryota, Reverse transcriptase zinc-binding domain protein [Artemisia annua]
MDDIPPRLEFVVMYLIHSLKGWYARSIAINLFVAATCYHIWHERNSRLFKKKLKTFDQIFDDIMTNVRPKIPTFRFKKDNGRVRQMVATWKLLSY